MSRVRFVTCSTCGGAGTLPGLTDDAGSVCPDCRCDGEVEDDDADRQIDALDMIGLDPWGHEK